MKRCSKCGEVKPTGDYRKDKARKDGLFPYCKKCCRSYEKEPVRLSASRIRARAVFYKIYGITEQEYQERFEKQKGLCGICHDPEPTKKRLAVDHNPNTGKVRGLLCSKCNPGIGLLKHSITILQNSIEYLKG